MNGASCGDLDQAAGAIFEKIYKDTGWKGNAIITFEGGLVSKATGKGLRRMSRQGSFSMDPAQAKQIDWSNSDDLGEHRLVDLPRLLPPRAEIGRTSGPPQARR